MGQGEKKDIKKFINLFLLGLFFVAFIFLFFWNKADKTVHITLKGEDLNVLIANTSMQKYKGLGGKKDLNGYDGMIFPFTESGKYAFVMRDMLFPIDIVWFYNGEVVDIAPNLQPENVAENDLTRYYPRKEANLVLELPAGWTTENGLKIGDKLIVPE